MLLCCVRRLSVLLRWPSVPDLPGQSLFLTSSPGKKSEVSRDANLSRFFGLVSLICPDLTNCCVVSNWNHAVLWVLTIHTVHPDRCLRDGRVLCIWVCQELMLPPREFSRWWMTFGQVKETQMSTDTVKNILHVLLEQILMFPASTFTYYW